MAGADSSTADGPARRRESWSLTTIVERVAGRPITDFQDPSRPVHPYLAHKLGHLPPVSAKGPNPGRMGPGDAAADPPAALDPVDRVYPPLTRGTGRAFHGPEHQHDSTTLEAGAERTAGGPGVRSHPPGPSRRPERVYLHYLLLHMDRLSDHALGYLKRAVDEELAGRERPPNGSTPPPAG